MERRRFLRSMTTGGIAAFTLGSASLVNEGDTVTILHTNDTHSHIDPFPTNHSKYPGQGGAARRKQLIDLIREQSKDVLLLDAGDIFQGTPYFNVHGGELEFKLMSEMGYDAATMGNHDFDAGIDGFDRMLPQANFPFLCANYDFSNTKLNGKTKPYKIFKKGKIKIGVFGIGVELAGLVSPELFKETQYLDPITNAQKIASELKHDYKCNLVVCLSHLGYKSKLNDMCDPVLAKETSHIDLIIGGHTHTFLKQAEMHQNKEGKAVLINQVGWAGLILGRIDFHFDKKGNPDLWTSNVLNTNYSIG
tara:strand:+ start:65274 stop:66191 length:918 start_codon:yes stop_codon:yes gene_type:complete